VECIFTAWCLSCQKHWTNPFFIHLQTPVFLYHASNSFVLKLYAVMCTFYWQFFTDNCWVRFRFLWACASCLRWGLLLLFFRFLWHFWLMRVCFSMPVQLIVLLLRAVMYLTQNVDHLWHLCYRCILHCISISPHDRSPVRISVCVNK